jgi:alpha-mannosidase
MQRPDNLAPAEVTTLERLHSLSSLPDGPWRTHQGDLAHGESPTLDDSQWQSVTAPATVGKDAVWFRRQIVIPHTLNGYSLNGTDINFQFQADANGPMPEIIYFNGRRVALGDDLEEIALFQNVKPGDKVLVAVKLLPTVDDKRFRGVAMKINFATSRPSPQDVEKQLISAAYLVPSLAPNDAQKAAILSSAIATVNLKALDAAQQQTFDASLRATQSKLDQLRPLLQTANYHLTGNSHIDAAWLWPWTETVDVVKRTFTSAVQLMNEYPAYTYTQSAAAYSQWMADKYPSLNAQIKQRIDEGRWELVGGMWVEPDLNMPDGESQVRQLLVGQAAFQNLYSHTARIGWNPDSFGYNWQLPQIYKRSGIDYFVTQKMHWNDTNQLPLKLFWWQSPDGSKVLTYFPDDYAYTNLDPVRLAASLAKARTRSPGMTNMLDLFGVGDHGGGPTRTMLDEGIHWMEPNKVVPKEEFGTALPYFQSVQAQLNPDSPVWDYTTLAKGDTQLPTPAEGQISIPTWNSELYFEYHRGVFTTQAAHKRDMRDSEEWTLNAEKYAALAWLDGKRYPADELNDAWRKVLFNQFHDLAAGSGIATIYRDAQKDYDDVHWATNEVSRASLTTIASRINTRVKGDVPILVFNPLAWPRSGIVEVAVQMPRATDSISILDTDNHAIPSQILSKDASIHLFHMLLRLNEVPSLGYTILHAVDGHKDFDSDLKADGLTMENSLLRVTVDAKTGCITSLFDKRANFETLAPNSCGNELQAYADNPKQYDAWNIDPGTYDVPPTLIHDTDSVQLVENTSLRAVIRVERHWRHSTFSQDLILYTNSSELVVTNNIDWHESHVLLKAAFPLAASSPMATFEIPYGNIQRPTTRNNSFEKAKFEVPALRWADEGNAQQGFSLINNSKYGYDAVGTLLRLTLLRSPTWPDPDADRGVQRFEYALYPHIGSWKAALTEQRGYEFNYRLEAMQVEPHEGELPPQNSFANIVESHVILTALKKAETGNALIARFFEYTGEPGNITLTVPPGAKSAAVVNLMEQPTTDTLQLNNNAITVPVTPYQIQTVRIDY